MLKKNVKVRKVRGKGRGVFAMEKIRRGEIIEKADLILLSEKEFGRVAKTKLYHYAFEWGRGAAISLGFGGLYNHSYEPNAEYEHDTKRKLLVFRAIRDIKPGEEIVINYNGDPNDQKKVWFDKKRRFSRKKP